MTENCFSFLYVLCEKTQLSAFHKTVTGHLACTKVIQQTIVKYHQIKIFCMILTWTVTDMSRYRGIHHWKPLMVGHALMSEHIEA